MARAHALAGNSPAISDRGADGPATVVADRAHEVTGMPNASWEGGPRTRRRVRRPTSGSSTRLRGKGVTRFVVRPQKPSLQRLCAPVKALLRPQVLARNLRPRASPRGFLLASPCRSRPRESRGIMLNACKYLPFAAPFLLCAASGAQHQDHRDGSVVPERQVASGLELHDSSVMARRV
jgi:hypothetical protein